MANGLTVVLRRGDLARARACAIVTSANDALSGNANPNYWRFAQRVNADGRVRALGGPALAAACEALPLLPSDTAPRDIQRWESTAKRGVSARVRCRVGAAVATPAFGPLLETTRHVIHAVAPDAEFGYEGHYQGAPGLRGDKRSAPPLVLLRSAFASALDVASSVGARRVAVASLGAGVKGWRPAISAGVALDAVATMAGAAAPASSSLAVVEFVIGEKDDAAWVSWERVARQLLGAPAGGDGACEWELSPTDTPTDPDASRLVGAACCLPLHQVDAFAYFAKSSEPRDGWAGKDWRPTENGW